LEILTSENAGDIWVTAPEDTAQAEMELFVERYPRSNDDRWPVTPGGSLLSWLNRDVALSVTLAAVMLSAPVPAPASPQQPPTFRSGVELIEVDVSVIDREGRPIADLQASDFTVTVDGGPRRVVDRDREV